MPRKAKFDRQSVLRKALDLFARQGYTATSMKDLELALDMRPGSIYAAFGSKERLFTEVLAYYAENTIDKLKALIDGADSPLAGVRAYLIGLADLAQAEPAQKACLLVSSKLELSGSQPVLSQAAEDYLADLEDYFCEVYSTAMLAGQLPRSADPRLMAQRLQVAIMGLRVFLQRNTDPLRIRQLAGQIGKEVTCVL
ncbi:TetR/AcrR family transcriptional regulator [Pseudidiomarina sp.]|uniref:TetR/AcrR family transcriptional regulator n=1 Tax=Pseudidiomarina sp. TaxID=2081707 RepID=UPI00299EACF6|nr:TetR/AcrR family transcriptional regulator [Pseudidiomarina sp.]MDX1705003.1 TetR/AcrR family transcriptional regulator [Pseudidiomarina sp.]